MRCRSGARFAEDHVRRTKSVFVIRSKIDAFSTVTSDRRYGVSSGLSLAVSWELFKAGEEKEIVNGAALAAYNSLAFKSRL